MCFVDADDMVVPDMLEAYSSSLQDNKTIVFAQYSKEKNEFRRLVNKPYYKRTVLRDDYIRGLFKKAGDEMLFVSVWGKLYPRYLIDGIFFRKAASVSEDFDFNLRVSLRAQGYVFIDKIVYYYRPNEASLTHSNKNFSFTRSFIDTANVYAHAVEELDGFPSLQKEALSKAFRRILSAMRMSWNSTLRSYSVRAAAKNLDFLKPYIIHNKKLTIGEKILMYTFSYFIRRNCKRDRK